MEDRLNLGCEVRELKLGSTFYSQTPRTSFHTLKCECHYNSLIEKDNNNVFNNFSIILDDFKPASVDLSKIASLDVTSNNQVTVTVPHLGMYGIFNNC